MSLLNIIKSHIKKNKYISIYEYMSLCLGHPEYGYYMRKDPFGAKGDFITAPEISQMFGEMIGVWCVQKWKDMGYPENLVLAELGPGRGTLMQDLLRATGKVRSPGGCNFHDAISVHLVETSPALKQIQQEKLDDKKARIFWHEKIEEIPEESIILVANEFFDALPIHQFVKTKHDWQEKVITFDDDKLIFQLLEEGVNDELKPQSLGDLKEGAIYEIAPEAVLIMSEISRRIKQNKGAALVIDYGYSDFGLGEDHFKDTLQAVKDHKYHPVFETPGKADLTAHVNFSLLQKIVKNYDVCISGILTQGYFLSSMGIEVRANLLQRVASERQKKDIDSALQRLIAPDQMGNLFKVLEIC